MCFYNFTISGNLIIVTNRLQLFGPTLYDFTGASGANFRIVYVKIGADSYMDGALKLYSSSSTESTTSNDSTSSSIVITTTLFSFLFSAFLL